MTKEQEEKTIKYLEILRKEYLEDTKRRRENGEVIGYGTIEDIDKLRALYIGFALEMLKEKDKEIEKLKQALARNIAKNFTHSMKESAKSKEDLEMLNIGWQIELEKKDRQINFMANFINDNIPYTKDTKELENEEGIRTADFTAKYFERKANNGRD